MPMTIETLSEKTFAPKVRGTLADAPAKQISQTDDTPADECGKRAAMDLYNWEIISLSSVLTHIFSPDVTVLASSME